MWYSYRVRVPRRKPLIFMGSSEEDLAGMPRAVKRVIGHALHVAQAGGKHEGAKPLRRFRGAGVLEVVEDYQTDTYRAVYTVRFTEAVYVLHVFQKKSRHGRETPKHDMDLIAARLRDAEADFAEREEALRAERLRAEAEEETG
jgi:phage-related protein